MNQPDIKKLDIGPTVPISCEECGNHFDYQRGKPMPKCPQGYKHPHTHEPTMTPRKRFYGGFSLTELGGS
jgi:predicted Zn-ribbon and HTH transcriptional regulator